MKHVDRDAAASAANAAQAPASHELASELRSELAALRTRCAELERENDRLRRASAQAANERDGYRQRYDTLPVACLTLAPDGGVLEGNATFATLLGLAAAPAAGVNFEAVIAVPQHVERFRDHLASVFSAPGLHCCELWLRKPDGAVTRVRLESTAMQAIGGGSGIAPTFRGGEMSGGGISPAFRGGEMFGSGERSGARQCRSVIAEITAAAAAGPGVRERFAPLTSMSGTVQAPSAFPPAAPAEPTASGSVAAAREQLATVLVVEDESLVRKAVQHYLTMAGYNVLAAVDHNEALEHSEQHGGAIDLILTDLSLPNGATGPQVVEAIRRRRPGAGVLYMTACPADMLARRGFVQQAGHTLEKPFSKETLLKRVAKELAAATAPGHDGK
jgi:CheY-like chemotaxis protein/PAS domain-containing protein